MVELHAAGGVLVTLDYDGSSLPVVVFEPFRLSLCVALSKHVLCLCVCFVIFKSQFNGRRLLLVETSDDERHPNPVEQNSSCL